MQLDSLQLVLVAAGAAAVLLAILLGVAFVRRRRERAALRERFGPEYERTVRAAGSRRAAVRDLREREALRDGLEVRALSHADRELVGRHLAALQFQFVDDPDGVMLSAGRVAAEVLRASGYSGDSATALRLFSVDHPAQAGAVRTVLEGAFRDVGEMRDAFVALRQALAEVADIRSRPQDGLPDDSRVPGADTQAGG
jgi:hypothetical protein